MKDNLVHGQSGQQRKNVPNKISHNTRPLCTYALRIEKVKMQCAFNGENIAVFDLSRSQETHVNYEMMESIKTAVFSKKYTRDMKEFKTLYSSMPCRVQTEDSCGSG